MGKLTQKVFETVSKKVIKETTTEAPRNKLSRLGGLYWNNHVKYQVVKEGWAQIIGPEITVEYRWVEDAPRG